MGSASDFTAVLASAFCLSMRGGKGGRGLVPAGPEAPFGGGEAFDLELARASAIRMALARYLSGPARAGVEFSRFLESGLGFMPRGSVGLQRKTHLARHLEDQIIGLARDTRGPDSSERLFEALRAIRPLRRQRAGPQDDLAIDPISASFPNRPEGLSPDSILVRLAARHLETLERERSPDGVSDFEALYFRYQWFRTRLFQFGVEHPETSGLEWFSSVYQRMKRLGRRLDGMRLATALRVDRDGMWLGAIELRTVPETSRRRVVAGARRFVEEATETLMAPLDTGRPAIRGVETGLVLHFVKDQRPAARPGQGPAREYGDPASPPYYCRYGQWASRALRQAQAVAAALKLRPRLLLVLRGVDIANRELSVPTWVTFLPLALVRRASEEAALKLADETPELGAEPFRTTYHCGEDFVRLVQGLRRVHEPIEFGFIREEDRLGHAVALGTDPESWSGRFPDVFQESGERLDDLLWELERYSRGDVEPVAGRPDVVREEIRTLAKKVFLEKAAPETLIELRRWLHEPSNLNRLGYPRLFRNASSRPKGLRGSFLCGRAEWRRCREPVRVPATPEEVVFLQRAQIFVRGELQRLKVTVEANPTSNLVIGDMESFLHHPVFALAPLANQSDSTPVKVSINSDNPLTFATCLAQEYAFVLDALLRAEVSEQEAEEWIRRARENGWCSRFTLAASAQAGDVTMLQRQLSLGERRRSKPSLAQARGRGSST
ncbi:MAG: hypothetical protein L6R30_10015 [Thermoanaerobaculia bacterium]|nr:hypothetical protein [Thermoanaerobaculia bacterium]